MIKPWIIHGSPGHEYMKMEPGEIERIKIQLSIEKMLDDFSIAYPLIKDKGDKYDN